MKILKSFAIGTRVFTQDSDLINVWIEPSLIAKLKEGKYIVDDIVATDPIVDNKKMIVSSKKGVK